MAEIEEQGFVAHEAFHGSGQKPGLEVWRIEQFEPVKQKAPYGTFYNGDAYIILSSVGKNDKVFSWNLHFWLGSKCAQDESGTAAIRTVELDEHLGGAAVQHREVQKHESKLFLSYFKKGIKYMEGGVKSGFNKVEPGKYVKRLFQCKGKHTVRVEQVEMKCASLNQGDVFILDDGPKIYVWIGPHSSKVEKIKGTEVARGLRDEEKAGRAHIIIVDKLWDSHEDFFRALGSKDKVIKAADAADDDDIVRKLDQEILLYKATPSESVKKIADVEEIHDRPLKQNLLLSENCYVLDSGYSGIYVWTGKKCSNDFKKKVWKAVNEFIDNRGLPNWISVTRVIDGGETPLFKQYFTEWISENADTIDPDRGRGNIAESSDEEFDSTTLHEKQPKAENFMPDDGSGTLTVYRVENFELKPVRKEAYGVFFGGDSYVIQYDYKENERDRHIIYFWQGLKSSTDERGSSALWAMKLDDDLGGQAVQIRVVMNKEPDHFLKLFQGKMIIFMDGHASGFQNVRDHDTYNPNEAILFQIRGRDEEHTRAIQATARGASLNSNDVFLMESQKKEIFCWIGKYAQEAEIEMAKYCKKFATPDMPDPIIIQEGEESFAFWTALGGEEPYYTGPRKQESQRLPARLFQCSNASGRFVVDEVAHFDQEDLVEDDVMMLDTYDEIFIWIGKGANETEKKEAYKTAYAYLQSDPTGRTPDNTLIIVARQGFEPPQFTGHFFPAWDADKWSGGKTFEEICDELGQENAGLSLLEDEAKKYYANYPLEVLQRKYPPEGVDVTKKEMYLTDEEFQEVFGLSKEAYQEKPEWKRTAMRKEHGLF